MLTAAPTPKLTGITIEGTYTDLYETVESIYRMACDGLGYDDVYWSVKNRLLGVCYDLRHAFQGDRNVKLENNHFDTENIGNVIGRAPKTEVHYSVEILFPEAVFVALSVSELYLFSGGYYGRESQRRAQRDEFIPVQKYSDFLRDRAVLDTLAALIFGALAEVIGEDNFEDLIDYKRRQYPNIFMDYVAQYLDKCNLEYLKTAQEKRSNKLKNIAKRLMSKPTTYENMKADLEYTAREYNCSIHELTFRDMDYPEEIEW